MSTVQEHKPSSGEGKARDCCWMADLQASRDLDAQEKERHGFVIAWFEKWRMAKGLEPGRPAARCFWKEQILVKPRQDWQLAQWESGIHWYLHWLALVEADSGGGRGWVCEDLAGTDAGGGRPRRSAARASIANA